MVTNKEFLETIFGDSLLDAHVTSFPDDPNNIPSHRHLSAWAGNYYSLYTFQSNSSENQYFTISTFKSDENGKARRRKSLFDKTFVIVLDDVKEKLPIEEVNKLPAPSYILRTSQNSEQWGYILETPSTDRTKVENLLDGLVSQGLAPDGKDPGMKGVTRYVRLPEGHNTKSNRYVDGKPFKCELIFWNPDLKHTLNSLASPFNINLDAKRREVTEEGASDIPDHPLLHVGLNIKEKRGLGRFDITCPWVEEHTNSVDNGSAIFTNEDGSLGFKCHHGACEGRTGWNLLKYLEEKSPGFGEVYNYWRLKHQISRDQLTEIKSNASTAHILDEMIENLKGEELSFLEKKTLLETILKEADKLLQLHKIFYHSQVRKVMGYNKTELNNILKELHKKWYGKNDDFYDQFLFIREQNRFFDKTTKIFYTVESFENSFSNQIENVKVDALKHDKVKKVDKIDFAPGELEVFSENGLSKGNLWSNTNMSSGVRGNCEPWLNHWEFLGWQNQRDHMLKFMSYTILHPEKKINHILLLGGMEGIGKDFLLYPLVHAMGEYTEIIDGLELLSGFNDYLLGHKHIHINESELGDHKQALEVSNRLKPLAASPPNTLRVNQKKIAPIKVRNIVNLTMTTNSQMPIKLNGPSRRFFGVWSDLNIRDQNESISPMWLKYFKEKWNWMKNENGVEKCIWHLRNCVDLSDFDPSSPPPMTEFLRTIREESKSAAQQTIEAYIENEIGAFKSDLLTANDACATLKNLESQEFMYVQPQWFTPTKVGRILRDIPTTVKLRARQEKEIRPWAIRNKEVYEEMSMAQLYSSYENQIKNIHIPSLRV